MIFLLRKKLLILFIYFVVFKYFIFDDKIYTKSVYLVGYSKVLFLFYLWIPSSLKLYIWMGKNDLTLWIFWWIYFYLYLYLFFFFSFILFIKKSDITLIFRLVILWYCSIISFKEVCNEHIFIGELFHEFLIFLVDWLQDILILFKF